MKKLSRAGCSMPAKVAAWFLLFVSLLIAIVSAAAILVMANTGFYTRSEAEVRENYLESILENKCYNVKYQYLVGSLNTDDSYYKYANFFFTLTLEDGSVAEGNYNGEQALYTFTLEHIPGEKDPGIQYTDRYDIPFTIWGCIPAEMSEIDEISIISNWISTGYKWKTAAPIISFAGFTASVLIFIYLMFAAGRRKDSDTPVPGPLDRIPFDLHTGLILFINIIAILLARGISYGDEEFIVWIFILLLFDFFLLVSYFMSISSRIKCGNLFRHTLIWMCCSLLYRSMKFIGRLIASFFRNLPLLTKTILGMSGIFIWNSIVIIITFATHSFAIGFFLYFSTWAALAVIAFIVTLNLNRLKKGGETIAAGDLNHRIDTQNMFWEFKRHAASLNSISEGMSHAVEERLRSERFRTELITNVSHDLKTPLTSIINYVDLLKKENSDDEKIRSYIEVLDRQASRLRKLTEDLIEASKASTGNIQIELSRCELGELLTQTAGEYEDKLSAHELQLICSRPEESVVVMADGRQLFRVIDNLMSNIIKYAQPLTRVYLNLEKKGNQAKITFRNTSKYALNISSDELMERFVRADTSRNTEGSGLGLSIAKSLVELQGGVMEITVDGDLFKVTLTFEIV